MSTLLNAVDESAALEMLHSARCTDGLPVVIPIPDRVARMVLASGLDGDIVLGEMGPQWGAATVEAVAVAAVMAGSLPDHMPVVVAAIRAICQPEFDLAEVQGTTHCIAPLIIVKQIVSSWQHVLWRALKHIEMLGLLGNLRDYLYPG